MSVLLALLACGSSPVEAPSAEPAPVAEPAPAPVAAEPDTLSAIESCMHWAGEEPYDDERAAAIAAGVAASCPVAIEGVKRDYGTLKKTPAAAAAVVDFLQHMGATDGLEALGPDPDLCEAAGAHWAHHLEKEPTDTYQPYFGQRCPAQAEKVCGPKRCQE